MFSNCLGELGQKGSAKPNSVFLDKYLTGGISVGPHLALMGSTRGAAAEVTATDDS